MTRTYSNSDPETIRGFAVEAARLIADLKCTDVVLLDVHGHSQVCDYIVIGSGTSQRQMKSVADDVADLGDTMGVSAYRSNRDEGTTWIVVDCVDVVVHLFEPEQRLYYDLELMWSQSKRVDWKRVPGASASAPAAAPKRAARATSAKANSTAEPKAKPKASAKAAKESKEPSRVARVVRKKSVTGRSAKVKRSRADEE
jgi:ribosome-associated protein